MPRRPLFDPGLPFPLRLSRRTVELYLECPRCFYLEARLGIKRPSIPSFTLNKAVDTLLKREFDLYRKRKQPHPFFLENGISGIPYGGPEIDSWRSVMKGIRLFLPDHHVELSGAPDEILEMPNGALSVVDFKATSKKNDATGIALAGMYQESYVRQISFYTFLLKENGFPIAKEGYLFIANANTFSRHGFGTTLSFVRHIVPVRNDLDWIIPTVERIYKLASEDSPPLPSDKCSYCLYVARLGK